MTKTSMGHEELTAALAQSTVLQRELHESFVEQERRADALQERQEELVRALRSLVSGIDDLQHHWPHAHVDEQTGEACGFLMATAESARAILAKVDAC